MAGNSANVRVWSVADVYSAPLGTTLPTDTTTALNAAFKAVGLLDDANGIVRARSMDQSDITAYGKGVIRTVTKNEKYTFNFVALEDTDLVYTMTHPGSTSATASAITTRTVKTRTSAPLAWVIHLTDGTITKRFVVPRGEAFSEGDVKLADDDAEKPSVTITAYASGAGVFYTEITDDAGAVAP